MLYFFLPGMQYGNPGGPPGSMGNPGGPPGSMMQHPGQGGPSPFDGMSSPPDMQVQVSFILLHVIGLTF